VKFRHSRIQFLPLVVCRRPKKPNNCMFSLKKNIGVFWRGSCIRYCESVLGSGGLMKLSTAILTASSVLLLALPSTGQTMTNLDEIEPPILAEAPPELNSPAPFLQSSITEPLPPQTTPESDAPANRYRAVVRELALHKHQFVHVKLRNGRVLTGLIRDVSQLGFTLYTDALSGPYIRYAEIAEQPRAVPAVGTRIRHGAEWTGLVLLTVAAIPILLPLALTGILPDC
jgi:hypothetical protein